ncbi:MAG TPA: CHASE3 domain-containing protein [Noviherbaspirillum sp.]|jgi:PAS domain S-box-containing protein|uniref:sensor histidine kinase n=1 Tax=Noviherbaspirillum sp. TaxID=1926288 RepID=UPI002DDD59E6|nr:CHASE3 domain-containing protein [Noviherbaspirillum sp.]HEV2609068.1 CHASE3 domain-containing protein [Noviherbaspirillum sp.]
MKELRRLAVPFALTIATFVATVVVSYLAIHELITNYREEAEARSVAIELRNLVGWAVEAETGQRGYVITGLEEYLEPYREGNARLPATFQRLRTGLADDPGQLRRLETISALERKRMAVLEESIRVRKEEGFPAAQKIVLTKSAKGLMDSIRAEVAVMEEVELRELSERTRQVNRSAARAYQATAIGGLLDIGLLIFLFGRVRADALSRIAAAREVSNAQQLLRTVIDGSPAVIYLKDPQGRYMLVNSAFRKQYAETDIDPIGRTDHELFSEESAREKTAKDGLLLEQGLAVQFEETHTGPVGTRIFYAIKVPLRDHKGQLVGICGVLSDVTMLKHAESEVRRLNQSLERRVNERTQELAEVNERLREANEQLEAFSYTVAHDLRAPLRGIQGFSLAVIEDYETVLDQVGKDYLHRISRAATRMEQLIEDLLSYGRLSRTELRIELVRMDDALNDARAMVATQIDDSQAILQVAAPLHAVRANHGACVMILQNLLTNAMKFVRQGTVPMVRIWSERRACGEGTDASGCIRLWVEDNGIGIPETQLQRIFRPFERLHGQDEYPGTGIGLASVDKAARRLGGACGVESVVNNGSRFWVELPAMETEA